MYVTVCVSVDAAISLYFVANVDVAMYVDVYVDLYLEVYVYVNVNVDV